MGWDGKESREGRGGDGMGWDGKERRGEGRRLPNLSVMNIPIPLNAHLPHTCVSIITVSL